MIKIALVQPVVNPGTSLGIFKAPTGLQFISAQLEDNHDVRMFHGEVDEIIDDVVAYNPDHIGISSMTNSFPEAHRFAREYKNRKNIPITLGGWHASEAAIAYEKVETETLEEILGPKTPFDFIIRGQGEEVFAQLITAVHDNCGDDHLSEIDGIGLYTPDGIFLNPAAKVSDLNSLKNPSWKGLPIESYQDQRTGELDLSVHFNRGCRYECGFCPTTGVSGRGVDQFSAERAVNYISELVEKYSPHVITFTDEDFFANKRWAKEVVKLLTEQQIAKQNSVRFDTFATVNDLYRFEKNGEGEFLDQMKSAGFSSFTIGIESFNPQVLAGDYNKLSAMIQPTMSANELQEYRLATKGEQPNILADHYIKKVQNAINFAHAHGILTVGDYIVGNQGESQEEVKKGVEKLSNTDNLFIAYMPILTPFPGTSIWKKYYDSGDIKRTEEGGIDWGKFDASDGAVELGYDVAELRNELEVSFYTSERYKKDMENELKLNPDRKAMFENRFNYLNRNFPGHELVQERLDFLKQS